MTNGIEYLLDTNYVIGLLKSSPRVLEDISLRQLTLAECGVSTITRMELLGFPGITKAEASLISSRLDRLTLIALDQDVEERTILLRQERKIKLPDAIIAATALVHNLELLTFDIKLLRLMSNVQGQ